MSADIYLYAPETNPFDIILSLGLRVTGYRLRGLVVESKEKPVVGGSLYLSLVEQYGQVVGGHVFEKMFEERSGPFAEGAKYDPAKRSVARKIAKAGGLIPDPTFKLAAFLRPKRGAGGLSR